MSFFTWFTRYQRTYSQRSTVVKQRDGSWTARVDLNGFPDKHTALMASGAMFDAVALLRNYGKEMPEATTEAAEHNPKIIIFPKKGDSK